MEAVEAGQPRRRRLAGVAIVLTVLILGAVASGGLALAVSRMQQRLATQAMDGYIADISDVIADQVNHYGDALTDLSAAISAQDDLTKSDFVAITASLDRRRLPGASGVSFVVPAFDAEVDATQVYWRAQGASGLTLPHTGTDVQHEFVTYSRTFTGTAATPGRDLSGIPENAETLRLAAETGLFTLGPAHVLLKDQILPVDQQQMAFTLAEPVFGRPGTPDADHLRAWLAMGVRGASFLSQTLHTKAQGDIQLELTDPAAGGAVIASVTDGTPMHAGELDRARTLLVGQHTWRLTLRPTTSLLSSSDQRMTLLTLLAGAIVTLLLATLVGVLAGARARAMDRVDVATAALRKDIESRQAVETQLREREGELRELAFHDPLTGLANRVLFYDRVEHALKNHARGGQTFAVFFLDLDGFKQVNDELGHSAGDAVLREVAERLRGCLRDGDTVARFGGDEFAVVAERLADPDDVHITAKRIVEAIRLPITIGSRTAKVTASVGVALNRADDSADDILREADLAMYSAKTTGKCRHVLAGA